MQKCKTKAESNGDCDHIAFQSVSTSSKSESSNPTYGQL